MIDTQAGLKAEETCLRAATSVQADDEERCGHMEEGTHWNNIWEVKLAVLGD